MIKVLTRKEYKRLRIIESAAHRYACSLKNHSESTKLNQYRILWKQIAEELDILQPNGEEVKYRTDMGEDYSYGYNFGDVLA
jgi:hypothetical protein